MGLYDYVLGWRKLGIRRGDLVLEVGSGPHPFARSDVLCDMFLEDGVERAFGRPVVVDRPFVCANAEMLPFRDDTFDFLLSSHVLEHLLRPESFLREAMRVSRRGYLVTPSEFCERIMPQPKHLWLVSVDQDGTLVLSQKRQASESDVPGLLHEAWLTDRGFRRFFQARPDLFETRFAWEDDLAFDVIRREERPDWFVKGRHLPNSDQAEPLGVPPPAEAAAGMGIKVLAARKARELLSKVVRRVHSPQPVDLYSILACPACKGQLERRKPAALACTECGRAYPVRPDGIPVLLHEAAMNQGEGC